MSKPRILIPVPTSFDEPYNTANWMNYAAAVTAAGGDPVRLELTHSASEIDTLVDAAQGILLPGSGADVDPSHYGHDRIPECAEADDLREETDKALFAAAERTRKPLLGICFGTQSMNVFYGGTLHQDIDPVPVNHRAGRAVITAHSILFPVDSRLGRILAESAESTPEDDKFSRLSVNSSHHQAIAIAGAELRVVGRCPADAVIEAVEGADPNHWLIGVQWHPERTTETSAASRALFAAFLQVAETTSAR
ncbi:gamma-glutamyl-gamma-aminobutyrate hydrolase family protein [Terriglobus roseus]|uniref:Putative glutamine amidotransferase n=1 Tax=Terriglobus roseus TaxID=392734 RepID=A0A1H4NFI9_9BACT|nr:gamma-glutamyl-gamma-aminobutyrate hydrolase family protein [Terriglobus roseus]SEB94007.1 putative glutamine amidotransferase [Terriglobus roseus]